MMAQQTFACVRTTAAGRKILRKICSQGNFRAFSGSRKLMSRRGSSNLEQHFLGSPFSKKLLYLPSLLIQWHLFCDCVNIQHITKMSCWIFSQYRAYIEMSCFSYLFICCYQIVYFSISILLWGKQRIPCVCVGGSSYKGCFGG